MKAILRRYQYDFLALVIYIVVPVMAGIILRYTITWQYADLLGILGMLVSVFCLTVHCMYWILQSLAYGFQRKGKDAIRSLVIPLPVIVVYSAFFVVFCAMMGAISWILA